MENQHRYILVCHPTLEETKKQTFEAVINIIKSRLEGWKSNNLSKNGSRNCNQISIVITYPPTQRHLLCYQIFLCLRYFCDLFFSPRGWQNAFDPVFGDWFSDTMKNLQQIQQLCFGFTILNVSFELFILFFFYFLYFLASLIELFSWYIWIGFVWLVIPKWKR